MDPKTEKIIIEAAEIIKRQLHLKEWLTPPEAMDLLGCQKSTLYKLANEGKLTYSELSARHRLYNRKSILKFIESKTIKSF